jgi:cytochrome c biogenesis protein CcmG/thiol:disulfide interchange protein DsbE
MKRAIVVTVSLATIGLVVYVLFKSFGSDPRAVPFMLSGQKAPDFAIKRLDTGEVVRLSDYKGRPIVVNFWATWCGPCAMEHPVLEWGAKRWKDQVVFLGIVFEDSEQNTKDFLSRRGWSLTQLFDATSTVAVDYGVAGVPETYFITRDGLILGKIAAPLDHQLLASSIAEILK